VFNDKEEHAITTHIIRNYLVSGALFTDSTFREIATMADLEKSQPIRIPNHSTVLLVSLPV
jgi:hypothetical protein